MFDIIYISTWLGFHTPNFIGTNSSSKISLFQNDLWFTSNNSLAFCLSASLRWCESSYSHIIFSKYGSFHCTLRWLHPQFGCPSSYRIKVYSWKTSFFHTERKDSNSLCNVSFVQCSCKGCFFSFRFEFLIYSSVI